MLLATILMFCVASVHMVVNLFRLIQAFIFHRESDIHPDGPAGYLGVAKDTSNIIQGDTMKPLRKAIIADLLLIDSHSFRNTKSHRRYAQCLCYLIWSNEEADCAM